MTATEADRATAAGPAQRKQGRPGKVRSRRGFWRTPWPHIILILGVIALAQAASGNWVSKLVIPSPLTVWNSAVNWISSGYLLAHTLSTLYALGVGFVVGGLLAFVVAVIFSELPALGRFSEPYVIALSVVPAIALVPLFVVWLGLGIETKIWMGIVATFFTVFVVGYDGLKYPDAKLIELARILKANRWQRLVKFKLWGAVPFFISAAKVSLPKTALAVVVSEYLAGNSGLGFAILRAGNQLDVGGLFVGVITLTILIHLLSLLIIGFERLLLGWIPKEKA